MFCFLGQSGTRSNNNEDSVIYEKEENKPMLENKPLTGYPSIDKPWEKYYSEAVRQFVFPKTTMYRCIYENNKQHLNRIAMEYYEKSFTYQELFAGIDRTAKALGAIGVQKGEIITIAMPTTPEMVYLLYAISKIGAVANMIDPRTSREGIIEYTREAGSKLFITIDLCYPKIKEIMAETNVQTIISVSAAESLPTNVRLAYRATEAVSFLSGKKERIIESKSLVKWGRFLSLADNAAEIDENFESAIPVAILHTGGTTGTPKGVVLSNEAFNTIAYQYKLSGMHLFPGQRFLNIMPPFIAYGVGAGLHMPFVIGMTSILIPQFVPTKFAKMIRDLKPNHMAGVPSHWGNVIESRELQGVDLSYLITPAVGGDAMNLQLEKCANRFLDEHRAPNHIIKGYGITEECSLAAACVNEINAEGSVGIPLPQNIISVFSLDTGEELQYGQQGEVCISGPTTMLGYLNNQEATDALIRTHDDGRKWIHTGDLGYITEDGMLYIDGRMKRMIIRQDGFKVFPSMIEKIICENPDVADCCVVGVTDNDYSQGQLPFAFVVLHTRESVSTTQIKEALVESCQRELPEYAQPIDFRFVKELPTTGIGKVDYRSLEKIAEEKA